jgi:4-hydroxyphenylpyruvate dioxygenase
MEIEGSCSWVEDATSAYQETMKRGALFFMEPTVEKR